MPSVYRVEPYSELDKLKQVLAGAVAIAVVGASFLSNVIAGFVTLVLCGWLPVGFMLHHMNFNRNVRYERLELDESAIRLFNREDLRSSIDWPKVDEFGYGPLPKARVTGYFLRSNETMIELRDDFVPHEQLLAEVAEYTGKPIPAPPETTDYSKVDESPDSES